MEHAGDVGVFLSVFSVLFLEAWYILLGVRLLHLWRGMEQHPQLEQGVVHSPALAAE